MHVWQAFPPMSSYGTKATQKLAGLYGLRAALQGSGAKRFIMVRGACRMQARPGSS